jgi:hypothetical protein
MNWKRRAITDSALLLRRKMQVVMTLSSGAVLAYSQRVNNAESKIDKSIKEIEEMKRRAVRNIEFGAPG